MLTEVDAKEEDAEPTVKVEEGEEDPEAEMAAMMGFGGFNSTKVSSISRRLDVRLTRPQGKSLGVNADGAVKVHKQRTWRQYMNRRGGFNRPLEKMK